MTETTRNRLDVSAVVLRVALVELAADPLSERQRDAVWKIEGVAEELAKAATRDPNANAPTTEDGQ